MLAILVIHTTVKYVNAVFASVEKGSLTNTIIANSTRTPITITIFNMKSNSCPTIAATAVDTPVSVSLRLLYPVADSERLVGGLRLVPIRRTQKDIEGLSPSDVAQMIVDHSSSL